MSNYDNTAFWDHVWTQEAKNLGDYEIETHDLVRMMIPEDVQKVVDVGCGSGTFTNTIVDKYNVTAVDFNEMALKSLKCETRIAPITAIPAADGEFDLSMAMQVLEHLPYDGTLATGTAELARVSSKYVMVTVPANDNPILCAVRCPVCKSRFHLAQHIRFFRPQDFDELVPGFQLIKLVGAGKRYCGSPFLVNLALAGSNFTGASIPDAPCLVCGSRIEMVSIRKSLWSIVFMGLNLSLLKLKSILRMSVPYNYIALYEKCP